MTEFEQPGAASDPEADARVFLQQLQIFLGVATATWVFFVLQYVAMGRVLSATIDAAVVLAIASLWVAARVGGSIARMRLIAHLTVGVNAAGLFGASLTSGQSAATSLWFLVAIPLYAAYQLGVAAAIGWGAAVLAILGGQYVLGRFVTFPPEFLASGTEAMESQFMLTIVISGFAVATRILRDRHVQALHQREAEIGRQAEALRMARDEAVRLGRVKSEFLANMSHEIRTPLNGVLGFTQVLLRQPLQVEQRSLVEAIASSGSLLLAIVNDILDFSKAEAGQLVLNPEPVEIRALLAEILQMFRADAASKGLALDASVEEGVPAYVETDGMRLRQVLCNLVGNAVKFTLQGGIQVRVQAAEHGVHAEVRDTGVGIPSDQMDLLFKEFSQVDSSTTRKFGGTGLGLAISRRLVELMGGRIWVESELDRGSTFHFHIPAPPVEGPPVPALPAIQSRQLRSLRILVAEDNEVNQEVMARMLERLGCAATIVANGRLALQALERESYDVVFIDMQMPVMDGVETCIGIRQLFDGRPRPRLVALSANVLAEHREQMLTAGVDVFLSKPLTFEALESSLDDAAARTVGLDQRVLGRMRDLFGKTPTRYATLLESHRVQARKLLARLEAAFKADDRVELHLAAHSLKGSSAQFGSVLVRDASARLEAGAEGTRDEIAAGLAELRSAVDVADTLLEAELARTCAS